MVWHKPAIPGQRLKYMYMYLSPMNTNTCACYMCVFVQVPVGLHPNRQQFLAIKWLIVAARERPGKGMADKLAKELIDAYNNEVCPFSW